MSTKSNEITTKSGKLLLKQLQDWLPEAEFVKTSNGNRKYNHDERLNVKVIPLLKDLGLHVRKNVNGSSSWLIKIFSI